jgi:dihydroorotate dehydrogenase
MEKSIYFNISSPNPPHQGRAFKRELSALKPSTAGEGLGEEK